MYLNTYGTIRPKGRGTFIFNRLLLWIYDIRFIASTFYVKDHLFNAALVKLYVRFIWRNMKYLCKLIDDVLWKFWNLVLWLVKLNCFLTHVILCQTVNDYWCKTNWCTMMLIIANWCVISLPLMVIFIALYNIEIYQSILCVPYDLIKHSNP